jgi:sulfur-oxidizing protein SoxB
MLMRDYKTVFKSIMRKKHLIFPLCVVAGIIAFVFAVSGKSVQADPDAKKIRLLWTNDTHGYLKPLYHRDYYDTMPDKDFVSFSKKEGKIGGMAHIATLVKKLRAESPDSTALFDAGDTWHGTGVPLFEEGRSVVKIMNRMGYDAMTPGNVEYLYPKNVFLQRVKECNFPVIAANLSDMDTDDLILSPYTIKQLDGVKVGIIGLTYQWTAKTGERSLTEGWSFGIREKEVEKFAAELREKHKCDIVIAISHMGKGADLKFASRVNGLDAILGAHTHDLIDPPIEIRNPGGKTTLVCQAGSHGKNLGRLDLWVKNGKVVRHEHQIYRVRAKAIPPDPEIQKIVDEEYARYKWMGETIGKTKSLLYRRATWQNTMDNFITDAYRRIENADVAFGPAWRFGATILPGDITVDDVYNMVPVKSNIWVVGLDGGSIKDIIEDALDNVLNEDPYLTVGGDLVRFSGMEVWIDTGKPAGWRVVKLLIGKKPYDPKKIYKVATAGGLVQNHAGVVSKIDTGKVAPTALIDYIKASSPISSQLDDRIRDKDGNKLTGQKKYLFMGVPLY